MQDNQLNQPAKHSTFAGDVLKMSSAPVFTQILGLILMPVITRLYTPGVFGVFNLFYAVAMPISVFATMGYNGAIILPQKDEVAANMLGVSLAWTLLITALTIPLLWLGSDFILRLLKARDLGIYIWLVPLHVLIYGLYLSFRFWNIRCKHFGRVAVSRIADSIVNKSVSITAGLSGLATPLGLIIATMSGQSTMDGVLGRGIWKENKQLFRNSIRWHSMLEGIKRYRKFPMFDLWTNVFGRIAESTGVFLFSFYFSKAVIGYYGLGLAVLNIPMTFIGSSIGEVFFQRGARAKDEGASAPLVETLFKQMNGLAMLPFLLLAIIGESVFTIFFGAKWLEAGIYAQILSFNIFVTFIFCPILNLATILEKQEVSMYLSLASIIISFAAITVGGIAHNIYLALGMLSLFNGTVTYGFGLFLVGLAGIPATRIFGIQFKSFMSCLPIIIIVALAKFYFRAPSFLLIIISALGCLIYYSQMLKKDKLLRSTIMKVVRKVMPGDKGGEDK